MKKQLSLLAMTGLLFGSHLSFSQCSPSTANNTLDVNNVSMLVNSSSDLWWDFQTTQYEIPKGSGLSTTWSGGLWIGAKDVSGQMRLAATRYRQSGVDFWPGPIDGQGDPADCSAFDRVWKVSKQEILSFRQNSQNLTAAIQDWPGRDNPNVPATTGYDLAPFVDVNLDGKYNPADGDYPEIKGDEAMYWVFNDVGNLHTESNGSQMGIEVHVMAYAYNTTNQLNNATHYDYRIVNKSGQSLTEGYLGMFVDFDLGCPNDDFIGCDTARQLGYIYNGDAFDEDCNSKQGYGANPPSAGIMFTRVPQIGSNTYPMSSFKYMNNGINSEPRLASEFYQFLQGKNKQGEYDTTSTGVSYKYAYTGKPGKSGWTECSSGNTSGDRRLLMNFGPFDLNSGEKVEFSFSNIYARSVASSSDPCVDGIDALFEAADTIQNFMNQQPALSARALAHIENVVSVYPNPTNGQVHVDSEEEIREIEVLSINGQVVFQTNPSNSATTVVELGGIPAGYYIMHIKLANGVSKIEKLIKK